MAKTRGSSSAPRRFNPPRSAKSAPVSSPSRATRQVSRETRQTTRSPAARKSPAKKKAAAARKSPAKRKAPAASEYPRTSKRRRQGPQPTPITYIPPPLRLMPPPPVEEAPMELVPEAELEPEPEMGVPEAELVEPEPEMGVTEADSDGVHEEFGGDDEVDMQTDFGIEEEECANLEEQFGATDDVHAANDIVQSDSDSEYDIGDDEKIPEPLSSDDDETVNVRVSADNRAEDADEILQLGMLFGTREEFKLAVLKYSLKTRYDIKFYRSQATKIGAMCNDKEGKCEWRCYASYEKKKHMMQVTVYVNTHTCVRSGYSRLLKQGTIAWLFADRLRENPKMKKEEMAAEIKREYNLVVSEDVCEKAKSILAKQRRQSHLAHFSRIWDYQAEVLQSNEGSTFEIETVPGPFIGSKQRFFRLYICFKAQKESWLKTCRPIIGLDGAFLKWDIKGHLLAAVGRDGDNRIVPIAWAIVEIESDDNWDWFVRLLSVDLGLGDGLRVAIISDKQKGLVKAVHTVLPQAEHRQCARHILDNWKRDSHDMELQNLFWKIARSYNQGQFSANMDALQAYNRFAYDSLLRTIPATWSRAFFRIGTCCNDVLNNLCESFNRTIKRARSKPILELLEDIRRQCMVRTEKRSRLAAKLKSRFTKKAHAEIEKVIAGSRHCTRYMARNNLHEVESGGIAYRVDMNQMTCGCRQWQMTGIPCPHAASVIIASKLKVEDYVNPCYSTEMWRMTYTDGIGPVQGEMLWPRLGKLGVLPPPWRKGNPGRPSNHARRKGANETTQSKSRLSREGRIMTCSKCKQEGHNKTTCGNDRVETTSRGRGRPKKPQVQPTEDQASQVNAGSQSESSHAQGFRGRASQLQPSRGRGSQLQGSRGRGSRGQASQVHGSQGDSSYPRCSRGSEAPEGQDSLGAMDGFLRSVFED